MRRRQRVTVSAALACGLFLCGCTSSPEPLPAQPTLTAPSSSPPMPSSPPVTSSTAVPPAVPTSPGAGTPLPSESATLAPAFQELRATLELFSREKLQDGASAVLITAKVGGQRWTHAAGVRSRDGGAAVQPGDRFDVGGQLRAVLGVSVMKLVEEGRLRLDDVIGVHLPGSLPVGTSVTVRQLLGDTAGVPPQDADALLIQLVERLRGAPFGSVLQTDVLAPLDLRSSGFFQPGTVPPEDMVHGYVLSNGETVDVTGPEPGGPAAGGLMSTVEDITTFYAALLRGQLLTPQSLIDMKGTVFADYGLGLDQWDDRCTNGSYFGNVGDIPGYGSVAISSADGNRQLAVFVALPPQPVSNQPSALVLEMTGVAQVALNSGCRFQFR